MLRHRVDVKSSLWLALVLLILPSVQLLRVEKIEVPTTVAVGSRVRLTCSYSHSYERADPLYSIKWYRGNEQFYEYIPGTKSTKTFDFPGINVDVNESNGPTVILNHVSKATAGKYKCEVTGDKPYFETDFLESTMAVIEIPKWGPEILGVSNGARVRVGESVHARCRIGPSKPPAGLSWVVNGKPDFKRVEIPSSESDPWGNKIQVLELRINVNPEHLRRGSMTLLCISEIKDVFRKVKEITIYDINRPKEPRFGWFSSGSENTSSLIILSTVSCALLVLQSALASF